MVVLLVLTGCQPKQDDTVKPPAQNEEAPVQSADWPGTWTRIALYSPAYSSNEPATLTLNADNTYSSSTAACATSGSLQAGKGTITLTMLQSSCPGGVQPPFAATYTYTIEEDADGKETMTTVTDVVTEVYIKSAD